MNTLIFLGGLGAGAFTASVLFLVIITRMVGKRRSEEGKVAAESNEANLHELKRRNDIGEDQRDSLRKVAQWCEHRLKQETK